MRKPTLILLAVFGLLGCQDSLDRWVTEASTEPPKTIKQLRTDGPFGLEMGMPLSAFESPSKIDFNMYRVYSLERDNPLFDFYDLSFSADGLCMVEGIGRDVVSGADAKEVLAEYAMIRDALTTKYGAISFSELLDAENAEDQQVESNEPSLSFLARLADDMHRDCWVTEENRPDFPHNIESLCVYAKAVEDTNVGYVLLRYEFDNYDDCIAMSEARSLEDL